MKYFTVLVLALVCAAMQVDATLPTYVVTQPRDAPRGWENLPGHLYSVFNTSELIYKSSVYPRYASKPGRSDTFNWRKCTDLFDGCSTMTEKCKAPPGTELWYMSGIPVLVVLKARLQVADFKCTVIDEIESGIFYQRDPDALFYRNNKEEIELVNLEDSHKLFLRNPVFIGSQVDFWFPYDYIAQLIFLKNTSAYARLWNGEVLQLPDDTRRASSHFQRVVDACESGIKRVLYDREERTPLYGCDAIESTDPVELPRGPLVNYPVQVVCGAGLKLQPWKNRPKFAIYDGPGISFGSPKFV